jgi:hypothetical protein
MPLDPSIISEISNNGLWKGLTDYVGNSTNVGQAINDVGNVWQHINKQPQSQLIGTPQQPIPAPQHDDTHFGEPDSNGIRWMNDAGKQASDNHAQQFTIPQPTQLPATQSNNTQTSSDGSTQPQGGGGMKLLQGLNDAGIIGKAGQAGGGLKALLSLF